MAGTATDEAINPDVLAYVISESIFRFALKTVNDSDLSENEKSEARGRIGALAPEGEPSDPSSEELIQRAQTAGTMQFTQWRLPAGATAFQVTLNGTFPGGRIDPDGAFETPWISAAAFRALPAVDTDSNGFGAQASHVLEYQLSGDPGEDTYRIVLGHGTGADADRVAIGTDNTDLNTTFRARFRSAGVEDYALTNHPTARAPKTRLPTDTAYKTDGGRIPKADLPADTSYRTDAQIKTLVQQSVTALTPPVAGGQLIELLETGQHRIRFFHSEPTADPRQAHFYFTHDDEWDSGEFGGTAIGASPDVPDAVGAKAFYPVRIKVDGVGAKALKVMLDQAMFPGGNAPATLNIRVLNGSDIVFIGDFSRDQPLDRGNGRMYTRDTTSALGSHPTLPATGTKLTLEVGGAGGSLGDAFAGNNRYLLMSEFEWIELVVVEHDTSIPNVDTLPSGDNSANGDTVRLTRARPLPQRDQFVVGTGTDKLTIDDDNQLGGRFRVRYNTTSNRIEVTHAAGDVPTKLVWRTKDGTLQEVALTAATGTKTQSTQYAAAPWTAGLRIGLNVETAFDKLFADVQAVAGTVVDYNGFEWQVADEVSTREQVRALIESWAQAASTDAIPASKQIEANILTPEEFAAIADKGNVVRFVS